MMSALWIVYGVWFSLCAVKLYHWKKLTTRYDTEKIDALKINNENLKAENQLLINELEMHKEIIFMTNGKNLELTNRIKAIEDSSLFEIQI